MFYEHRLDLFLFDNYLYSNLTIVLDTLHFYKEFGTIFILLVLNQKEKVVENVVAKHTGLQNIQSSKTRYNKMPVNSTIKFT